MLYNDDSEEMLKVIIFSKKSFYLPISAMRVMFMVQRLVSKAWKASQNALNAYFLIVLLIHLRILMLTTGIFWTFQCIFIPCHGVFMIYVENKCASNFIFSLGAIKCAFMMYVENVYKMCTHSYKTIVVRLCVSFSLRILLLVLHNLFDYFYWHFFLCSAIYLSNPESSAPL